MNDQPDSLPDVMNALRLARMGLEHAIMEAIVSFEKNSGLAVCDIEVIRVVRSEISDARTKTRIGAVHIDVRLD